MRRDHELIRELVLYVEEHDEMDTRRHLADFPQYDERTIARHMELLVEDGLVEANLLRIERPPGPVSGAVTRLTSKGHDFAESGGPEAGGSRRFQRVYTRIAAGPGPGFRRISRAKRPHSGHTCDRTLDTPAGPSGACLGVEPGASFGHDERKSVCGGRGDRRRAGAGVPGSCSRE